MECYEDIPEGKGDVLWMEKGNVMSKILVVLTGGTIGSCLQENVISAKSERSAQIVKLYEDLYGKGEEFVVVQPLNKLSENLYPTDWEKIADVLDKELERDYDGVIITHGSDTLAYTSSFMSMLYAWIEIPMVFVAANYPLDAPRSNGMNNFAGAVSFIHENVASGVFTIYESMEPKVDVYLPTRMLNSDPYFDQYRSFDRAVFGWMEEGKFVANPYCPVTADMINQREKGERFKFCFENEVMFLETYLGINFRNFVCGEQVKAVYLSLYHSATGPSTEQGGLIEFMKNCNEKGIQVYGGSFKKKEMNFYQSTDILLKSGLVPMCNMSSIVSYTKLVLAYNQADIAVEELLEKNIFFESLANRT